MGEQAGPPPRRDAILAIAAEQFARKGIRATTVREIADEAGILSGSLYHHFASKEAMVDEIIAPFLDGLVAGYREIVDGIDDPLEALRALIHRGFATIVPHRAALTIAQNESHHLVELERFAYLRERYEEIQRLWVSVFDRGIARGRFRSDLDTALIYNFMRDGISFAVRWYQPDGPHSIEEVAETYCAYVLGGLAGSPPVS